MGIMIPPSNKKSLFCFFLYTFLEYLYLELFYIQRNIAFYLKIIENIMKMNKLDFFVKISHYLVQIKLGYQTFGKQFYLSIYIFSFTFIMTLFGGRALCPNCVINKDIYNSASQVNVLANKQAQHQHITIFVLLDSCRAIKLNV